MNLIPQAAAALDAVRARRPLVHCITNLVTMNDCANAALAIGASPIMADDPGEAAEVAARADALVLNIGKLDPRVLESMVRAGRTARRRGIPVVFDPVGAGVSALRGAAVRRILEEVRPTILRCNRSEAAFIAGLHPGARGVDAEGGTDGLDSAALACAVSRRHGCAVALTGETDWIARDGRVLSVSNGHAMLSRVTGMGCAATVLVAACAAVTDDPLAAALTGVAAMGVAGECAYAEAGARGTGSFHIAVIDALSRMDGAALAARLRCEEGQL